MTLITSYSTLQSELKDEMDRSDDTSAPWTRFIQNFEEAANRDPRIKKKVSTTLSVSSEETDLPAAFKEPVSLAHDSSPNWDPLELVPVEQLPIEKAMRTGDAASVPRKFAVLEQGDRIRVAPVPDATYTLDFTYWKGVEALGGSVLDNWLLLEHSDIYLQGCIVEAAKYFRDAEKLAEARGELERKIEELNLNNSFVHFAGTMNRVPENTIG